MHSNLGKTARRYSATPKESPYLIQLISTENPENEGIFFPRRDYLVEGRSEGLEGPMQMEQ